MAIAYTWIQGTGGDIPSYPARDDRRLIAALWDEGVLAGGLVTANGADRVLSLPVGTKAVIAGDHAADQGSYLAVVHTAAATVTIDAAPGSGSRIDVVGLRVRDLDEGGDAGNDIIFDKVTGTPHATTPTVPATPSSFLPLYRVTIAAGQVAVTTGMLADARVYAGPKAPIGSVRMHYGPTSTIPVGWEILQGQAWTSPTHDDLAARLGLTLPATSPDSRGRIPRGVAASGTGTTVGGTFGSDGIVLSTAQLPSHFHDMGHNHAAKTSSSDGNHAHSVSDPSHGHSISDPQHGHGLGGGQFVGATGFPGGAIDIVAGAGTAFQAPNTNNAPTGISIYANYTGISIVAAGAHTHTVDLDNYVGATGSTGSGSTITAIPAGIAVYLIVRVAA